MHSHAGAWERGEPEEIGTSLDAYSRSILTPDSCLLTPEYLNGAALRSSWATTIAILVVAAGALLFRLPRLDQRPLHTDEAVHAVKTGILVETGTYTYNPHEYHGPTPYYAAWPLLWLEGVRTAADIPERTLRLVPVLFGTALVLLVLLVTDGVGRGAAVGAAVLTALSPAMVFYSRYYIQEMLLVTFTFALIAFGWRYIRSGRAAWAVLAGAAAGGMIATKETCILAFGSMAGAALVAPLARRQDSFPAWAQMLKQHRWRLALALLAAGALVAVVMSGLFTNLRGPLDVVRAYLAYVGRAAADPSRTDGAALHEHPWYYYLRMLLYTKYAAGPWWSEGLIVGLSVIGMVAAFTRRARQGQTRLRSCLAPLGSVPVLRAQAFPRFLTYYTLCLAVVYAVIPYKTPWCMLGFLHGMILLAGVGAATLLRRIPTRLGKAAVGLVLVCGAAHLGVQAHRASYVYYADNRNPYVYAHSSTDVLRLVERLEDLAAVHPDGRDLVVKVVAPGADYWPLPWYLRRFPRVGYWTDLPENVDADVIVAAVDLEDALGAKLEDGYLQEYFGLRPEVLLTVYIRAGLWAVFMETRS